MNQRSFQSAVLLASLTVGIWVGSASPVRADAVGAELIVLTSHVQTQRDVPVTEYKRRLDDKANHILTPGVKAYYDDALEEPVWGAEALRYGFGLMRDSIDHTMGYVAVMGRWILYEGDDVEWSLQVGPGLLFRESWRDVPGYAPDNPLQESDHFLPGYEWIIVPLGDINVHYAFTPTLQGVWSIFPGFPMVITQSFGLRWAF